jgi:hypothetical protein
MQLWQCGRLEGSPWWLKIEVTQDRLNLALVREEDEHGIGPLPSSFRYVLGSLVRCLYRTAYPDLPISAYPHGLFDPGVPLTLSLALPDVQETAELLREFHSRQWRAVALSSRNDATIRFRGTTRILAGRIGSIHRRPIEI